MKTSLALWVRRPLSWLGVFVAIVGCAGAASVTSPPTLAAKPSAAALAPEASSAAPAPSSAEVTAQPARQSPMLAQEDAEVSVSARDPQWGKREAPVTIVAFGDFESPFGAVAQPTLRRVREAYGPDAVRLVWKNNPQSARPAARPAALAAMIVFQLKGSDAFWTFHDRAFANQQALNPSGFTQWATEAGVEPTALVDAKNVERAASKVDEDLKLASQVKASGAPDFFINGIVMRGAQPFEKFQQLIDAQLAEARKLVANGTPKSGVYGALTRANRALVVSERPSPPPLASGSIEASHILVQYAGAMRAPVSITRSKLEARQRIEEVLDKAKHGADFAQLAADYSDEPGAATRKGRLGTFRLGAMVKPFEQAAFALKIGELSGVVETDFGFHVIKRTQ